MMKQLFFVTVFIASFNSVFSQRISKITLTGTGNTELITVATDDAVINISPEGNVISYGIEYFSEKIANYSRIENYTGRVDMYGTFDDKAFQGKLKYLGKTPITYYASYDLESLRGKLKSIGPLILSYYMQYEDEALRGKIKTIGSAALTYFSSFDNESLKGKLKSAGITSLNYYSSFDDKAYKGKIKSIGQVAFSYYPSFDNRYAGAMKTGAQWQNINGIVFWIR